MLYRPNESVCRGMFLWTLRYCTFLSIMSLPCKWLAEDAGNRGNQNWASVKTRGQSRRQAQEVCVFADSWGRCTEPARRALRAPLPAHVRDVRMALVLSLANFHTIPTWRPHAVMKRHSTQRDMSWITVLTLPRTRSVTSETYLTSISLFFYYKIDWQERYNCFYVLEGCFGGRLNEIMYINVLWKCIRYYMQKAVFKFKIVEEFIQ